MKFKAYAWVSDDVLERKHLKNCLIIFCIARCTHYMDNKERVSRESLKSMSSLGSASAGPWEKSNKFYANLYARNQFSPSRAYRNLLLQDREKDYSISWVFLLISIETWISQSNSRNTCNEIFFIFFFFWGNRITWWKSLNSWRTRFSEGQLPINNDTKLKSTDVFERL